jgi:hypothetical protein
VSELTANDYELLEPGDRDLNALDPTARARYFALLDRIGDGSNLVEIAYGQIPAVVPTRLRRSDGKALLYPGSSHDFHGEPGVGKTLLLNRLVAEELDAGGRVLYVDFEMTRATIDARLQALGVTLDILADRGRYRYIRPVGTLLAERERAHLRAILDDLDPTLVTFDALGPALAIEGLDENSNSDFTRWRLRMIDPLLDRGILVVWLDHQGRDPATRGRGARGAGAKLGGLTGASYEIRVVKSFDRTHAGAVKLVVAKDRHGELGRIGETVALAAITPYPDDTLSIELHTPPEHAAGDIGDTWEPTELMERVSRTLEANPEQGLSKSALRRHVKGRGTYVDVAIDRLLARGHIATTSGPRGAVLHTIVDPYRQPQPDPVPDPVPPRPGHGDNPDPDPVPCPPPSKGGQGQGRSHAPEPT